MEWYYSKNIYKKRYEKSSPKRKERQAALRRETIMKLRRYDLTTFGITTLLILRGTFRGVISRGRCLESR